MWLSLVYLTLDNVRYPSSEALGATVPAPIRSQYTTFVYDVVNAKKSGYTLQTLKLEEVARREVRAS